MSSVEPSDITKIFEASFKGDTETLQSVLTSTNNPSQLVQSTNGEGETALHQACNRDIAQLLVEAVEPGQRKRFLLTTSQPCSSPLFWALNETALTGAAQNNSVDVVEYLCSLISADEVDTTRPLPNHTPLHLAESVKVAKILVESVPEERKQQFLLNTVSANTDKLERTALHTARDGEIARLLISKAQDKSAYVQLTNHEGRTALFYSRDHLTQEVLIEAVDDPLAYINHSDVNGDTALMYLAKNGMLDPSLCFPLDYVRDNFGVAELCNTLLVENRFKQNILHVVSAATDSTFEYDLGSTDEGLFQFFEESTIAKMLTSDVFGNNPLQYLSARLQPKTLHDICMMVPMWERKRLLSQRRDNGVCPLSILDQHPLALKSFMEAVFEGSGEIAPYVTKVNYYHSFKTVPNHSLLTVPSQMYSHHPIADILSLFKMMKYVLNEYPPTHDALLLSRERETSGRSSEDESLHQQKKLPWVYLDASILSQQDMQMKLYEVDTEDNHGELKVAVVTGYTSTQTQYLSPSGPDCLIVSVKGDNSSQDMFHEQSLGYTDVDVLLDKLTNTEGVQHINVNSTMSKHYRPSTKVDTDYTLVNGGGKALVICNTTGREGWQEEYEHAVYVLGRQLGLQVTTLKDQSVDEMKRKIETFAGSCDQNSLVVLSIMSHGDGEGNICGDGGNDVITVQEVVDALCRQQVERVTKVVFFSFCRGPIGHPRHNRAYKSWEYSQLPQLTVVSPSPVRRGVPTTHLEEVRKTHPFPSVDVPLNCYILFSTLPDSKSFRHNPRTRETNWMFRGLREYLADFYDNYIPTGLPTSSTTQARRQPHVRLVYLFTEVACKVRKESQATQVLNLCHARGRGYKPVHVRVSSGKDAAPTDTWLMTNLMHERRESNEIPAAVEPLTKEVPSKELLTTGSKSTETPLPSSETPSLNQPQSRKRTWQKASLDSQEIGAKK